MVFALRSYICGAVLIFTGLLLALLYVLTMDSGRWVRRSAIFCLAAGVVVQIAALVMAMIGGIK